MQVEGEETDHANDLNGKRLFVPRMGGIIDKYVPTVIQESVDRVT